MKSKGLLIKAGLLIMAIIALIAGLLSIFAGVVINWTYENKIECIAVITDVKTDYVINDAYSSYYQTYYAEYTANGENYTNVKIMRAEEEDSSPNFSVGDKVKINVDKNNPTNILYSAEGTIMIVLGIICFVGFAFFFLMYRLTKHTF